MRFRGPQALDDRLLGSAPARITDLFTGRATSVAPEFSRPVTFDSSSGRSGVNPASTNCRVRRWVPIHCLLSQSISWQAAPKGGAGFVQRIKNAIGANNFCQVMTVQIRLEV